MTATTSETNNATIPPPTTTAPVVVLDTRVVTGSGGGPDKTILVSPKFLAPYGYEMLCAYLTPPADTGYAEIERKAIKYGAPLYTVPDTGPFDVKLVAALLKLCREKNVQIWHGHDYKTNALGWALSKFHPMHLVSTVHGWVHHTARTPLYYKIDQWSLKRYRRVYCVSQDLLDTCLANGMKPANAMLLENGIDPLDFTRKRSTVEAKHALGLPTDGVLIGAAGRLEPEKAFDTLIRAIHRLREASVPARLAIVGEGHDRTRLEALIAELNLQQHVTLVGWQSDIRGYFEAFDVFALSSLREGLPNVLLEAMALEVPCVATRIAGIPKLITHGQDGLLVEPNDLAQLTTALHELCRDDTLREAYRTAARATIEARYSFARRIQFLARDYDAILGRTDVRRTVGALL